MKCYIVLVPVENRFVGRKECEKIENMVFNIKGNENTLKVRDKIVTLLSIKEASSIEVWDLTDFMDLVNDQEFNPENYFMSYVYVKFA